MSTAVPPPPSHFGRETFQQRVRIGLFEGIRTAIAAVLAVWLGNRLGLEESYWAAISAIVVTQSEYKTTLFSSFDRLVGTIIGALLGWGCATVWHGSIAVYGATIFLAMFLCWTLRLGTAGRVCGVTVSIITLVVHGGGVSHIALHRFLDVTLGIFVALGFSVIIAEAAKALPHHRNP